MLGLLEIPDRGHVPWPKWALEDVLASVPEDLRRMVRLGAMTCQRESDLIKMGPIHCEFLRGRGSGIWCRPKKTRRRRRSVFIPLVLLTPSNWTDGQSRRLPSTIPVGRLQYYVTMAKFICTHHAGPLTRKLATRSVASLVEKTPAGNAVCKKWIDWLKLQIARYEWELDPDDAKGPTIHGLRGTGVLLRWSEGFDVDQISNDIGMSRQMVEHYMRFKDQMGVAADGPGRLRLVRGD